MEYGGEQYDLHESLPSGEVEFIVDDNPNESLDTHHDNEGEIEPITTIQSYSKGPDGSYYLYNSQTGELDLNQPLPLMSEQEVAFETASAMGAAEVAVLAPGGTETQEIWSIQSLELSITAEGREVIILRATTEIREIVKEPEEEPEDTGDAAAIEEDETSAIMAYDASPDDNYDPTPSPQPLAIAEVAETVESSAAITEMATGNTRDDPVSEVVATVSPSIEQGTANDDDATAQAAAEHTTITVAPLPPAQENTGGFDTGESAATIETTPETKTVEIALASYESPHVAPTAQEKAPTPAQKAVEQGAASEVERVNVELEPSQQSLQEEPSAEILAVAAVEEDTRFEHQPQETLPELPRPAIVTAPAALPPEKVVYIRKAPAPTATVKPAEAPQVVKAPIVAQPTQQEQTTSLPQHEHHTEPRHIIMPEQRHKPPVIAPTEQLSTQPKAVAQTTERVADHTKKPGLTAKAPAEITKQTVERVPTASVEQAAELEEMPASVVASGNLSSANLTPPERPEQQGKAKETIVKEQGIASPRWERERNSQTLMPWLGAATINTHSYDTEDDVVITFNPGVRARNRRPNRLARTGSIAA
ncbi:MAG TPA: hypothetical protein VIQ80_01645 [Candidatus Saccharimonadales bacterium]